MKAGAQCAGRLGRRLYGGRQCPSHTKHPSGLCSSHRAALVQRTVSRLAKAAERWYSARQAGFVLDRLEAEEKLCEAAAAFCEAREGREAV